MDNGSAIASILAVLTAPREPPAPKPLPFPPCPVLPTGEIAAPYVAPLPHNSTGVDMIRGDRATVWKSLDKYGRPAVGDWDNATVALYRLGVRVRWNEWLERDEISTGNGPWTALQDHHLDRIAFHASTDPHNYRPAESTLRRAVEKIARDNAHDPARELLDAFEKDWDGTARLAEWLTHTVGAPSDPYHRGVAMVTLLGLVWRIRVPGVKFDTMPVFFGAQGAGKSTLAAILAMNDAWFTDAIQLGDATKELILLLPGKCVVEIGEMRTRGEVNAVKTMLSAQSDHGRPAYARKSVDRARRNIFIGTSNEDEFLEDNTGARRFLPVRVADEINLSWLRENIGQLIGEAAAMQSRKVLPYLPRDVWDVAKVHQEAARKQTGAEVLLEDWFAGSDPAWISAANLTLLLRLATSRDVPANVYRAAMVKLGFVSGTRRVGGKPIRVWQRGEPDRNAPGYAAQIVHGRPALDVLGPLMIPGPADAA